MQVGDAGHRGRLAGELEHAAGHHPGQRVDPPEQHRVGLQLVVGRVVDGEVARHVVADHLHDRDAVVERRRVDRQIGDAVHLGLTRRVEPAEVDITCGGLEQLAHAVVGEAEHVLEVAAALHLVDGDDLVAEVRRVHVRAQQAGDGMRGRQLVVRDDRERTADREVHPVEVTHERHVRGHRAHREAHRVDPRVVARHARPELGLDAHRLHAASLGPELELDTRDRRDELRVHLEARPGR